MAPKKIIILGSTGSIGRQALSIIKEYNSIFSVAALVCKKKLVSLLKQAKEFKPEAIGVLNYHNSSIPFLPDLKFFNGENQILELIKETKAELVLNGIAGSSGLLPSFTAIRSNKNLALANKETIVMAGPLILNEARKRNCQIIPVDSEHSAILQLLKQTNQKANYLAEIILTASGGPFFKFPLSQLRQVTVKQALAHPNWKMGKKISIDSATMANKALEIIEAHYLFNLPIEKIKVIIHPQSYVHSLIRTIDGSLYTQISKPDMRLPILNALTYPEMQAANFAKLELEKKHFDFFSVDPEKYPLLYEGIAAAQKGGVYPIVFNAANEIAVEAFLQNKISFMSITKVVKLTLERAYPNLNRSLDDVIFIDNEARKNAINCLKKVR